LALLIGGESMGIPLPGESALIASGVFARDGQLDIVVVFVVAATAAILGDNVGYLVGRHRGRQLFERPGPFRRQRSAALVHASAFFERHGAKAVFLGRWFGGLRIVSPWIAGMTGMRWRTFLFWNALGGLVWSASVGAAAYLVGSLISEIFHVIGVVGLGLFAVAAAVLISVKSWRRRQRPPAAAGCGTD
jgi:membrane-associated protein